MKIIRVSILSLLCGCAYLRTNQVSTFTSGYPSASTDARKIASADPDLTPDHVELALEPTLPGVNSLTKSIQEFVLALEDLTVTQDLGHSGTPESSGDSYLNPCLDLWAATCSKDVGHDPTGSVFANEQIEFEQLLPGFIKIMKPKLLEAIDYIYEHDPIYQDDFDKAFGVRTSADKVQSAKQCMAEYMVQRVVTEFAEFPLKCFQRSRMLLRDVVYNPNSIYLENHVRRAVGWKFTQSSEMKKIEFEIFPRVRSLIVERVKVQIKDSLLASQIIEKLNSIKYVARDCPGFGTDNSSYRSDKNTFTLCYGRILRNRSLLPKITTIAHELTHAFDPCVISYNFSAFKYSDGSKIETISQEFPFQGKVACLAREESVGAKMLTVPAEVCKSQFGESFADLIAADVVPEYLARYESSRFKNTSDFRAGYQNVYRSYCTHHPTSNRQAWDDVHPLMSDRTNYILGAHPHVRKQMGCVPQVVPASCR